MSSLAKAESEDHIDSGTSCRQRYLVQIRDAQGHFPTRAVLDCVPSPEEIEEIFGACYCVVKRTSPRIQVEWKQWVGKTNGSENGLHTTENRLRTVEKKSKWLTIGLTGVAVGEIATAALAHKRFLDVEGRVSRTEAAIRSFSVQTLECHSCGTPIRTMLQRFCASCGVPLNWPVDQIPSQLSSLGSCQCGYPRGADQKFCPNCGEAKFAQLQFIPVNINGN